MQKASIRHQLGKNVCKIKCELWTHAPQQTMSLFDDLLGAKRIDLPYRRPSKSWIKVKNKKHPAILRVKRSIRIGEAAVSQVARFPHEGGRR